MPATCLTRATAGRLTSPAISAVAATCLTRAAAGRLTVIRSTGGYVKLATLLTSPAISAVATIG